MIGLLNSLNNMCTYLLNLKSTLILIWYYRCISSISSDPTRSIFLQNILKVTSQYCPYTINLIKQNCQSCLYTTNVFAQTKISNHDRSLLSDEPRYSLFAPFNQFFYNLIMVSNRYLPDILSHCKNLNLLDMIY